MPFAWGVQDCCTWAAEAAYHALTGQSARRRLGLPKRPHTTARGAANVLRRWGGDPCGIPPALGCPALPRVAMAQRGDLVALPQGQSHALGVCLGEVSAFAGPDGLVFEPTLDCTAAWRV